MKKRITTLIVFFALCCLSCQKEAGLNSTPVDLMNLSQSDLEIYRNCIGVIKESGILGRLNSKKEENIEIDSVFAHSSLVSFVNVGIMQNKSEEEIKELDGLINGQNFKEPSTHLKNLLKNKDSNFLISFSKPNDEYITAFINEILWKEGSKNHLSERILGNMIFYLEADSVKEYHESIVIFELYN